ncbi:MAG: ATP-dependent zinc protease [Magnetococcales bacterium]|nr:ATP-dependent zinc protease [Magnetococcales bacterium]
MPIWRDLFLSLLLVLFLPASGEGKGGVPLTIGYLEHVLLEPDHVKIKAKIDTGAKTSSLGIEDLQEYEQDGNSWVRFSFSTPKGKKIVMERRVLRIVRIRRVGSAKEIRPVVELDICLDNLVLRTEVNLTIRKGMNYPMLLGRRFLSQNILIDPGKKYLTKPACRPVMAP